MVHGGHACDTTDPPDASEQMLPVDRSGRRADDDVGPERQLGVDSGLLVVGRGEEPELDAERQQETDDEEPAVDRPSAAARAGEQEAERRTGPSAGGAPSYPCERAPAQTDDEERGADPEQ